jgi:ankyrin repeat protein
MRPVLRQILNTRFPADAWALERLGRYLYDPEERPGTDDRLVQALLPLEFLQELPPERKNDLLGRIVQDDEHPVRFAIRLLQVHGADLDAKDAQGLPCVVRALMAGLPQSALNLLQAGANADSRGPGGATLLHLALRVDWDAVEYGQLPDDEEAEELAPCASLLVQLLKLGVNPATADDEGITPLQEAEAKGDEDAAGVLRKALEPARPGEGKAGGPVAGAASGSP